MEKYEGVQSIIGWNAIHLDDQTYLVGYNFDRGIDTPGYYFEIKVVAEIVRKVSSDNDLRKKLVI